MWVKFALEFYVDDLEIYVDKRKALTTKSSKITTKRSIASELWSITLVSCIIYGSARSHGEL
jgi:hypothetical protein